MCKSNRSLAAGRFCANVVSPACPVSEPSRVNFEIFIIISVLELYRELYRRLEAVVSTGLSKTLSNGLKGLEKESLRVTPSGVISNVPHPPAFGSALTHPYITTDYSEALLELITPPSADSRDVLSFLRDTHRYVYSGLGEELLWVASMPCAVAGDESVPIADYGSSNSGMMRHIYRRGLAHRYGRVMQVISGVHYNYSVALDAWPTLQAIDESIEPLSNYVASCYFGLVRNVLRYGWILVYLFGASPALCRSFLGRDAARFEAFDASTRYAPFATSLRMSDIGYTNSAQTALNVSYDDLYSYVETLTRAIETSHPPYESIGVVVDGAYRQLNTNILQIENEFYSVVRPKQIAERGEKPTAALARRGVAYVELRSLDVNPFAEIGIDEEQMAFLEAFMLFCLLQESPPLSTEERRAVDTNLSMVAVRGREPGLLLSREGQPVPLKSWANELVEVVGEVASSLSGAEETESVFQEMAMRVDQPDATPSATILRMMRKDSLTFFHFGLNQSYNRRSDLLSEDLDERARGRQKEWAEESVRAQSRLEAADEISFQAYLEAYLSGGADGITVRGR